MRGKLHKISVLEGKRSCIGSGGFEDGVLYLGRDEELLTDQTPADIKVGDMVMVATSVIYFLKTSKITKILEQSDKAIKFETETSIYEFTEE